MLCFLEDIMSMFQMLGKCKMTRFNLSEFTDTFISTSHMEHMFTIGKATPIFNMATFTECTHASV